MNMIEKVARALALQYAKNAGYREPNDDNWQGEYKAAKAAIEAMREPTEQMIETEGIYNCNTCGGHIEGYQKLIDAALKE